MTLTLADIHLTEKSCSALRRAYTQGLDPDTAHPITIHALELRGLIELRESKKGRVSWRTTHAGRELLTTAAPRFLAARSQHGYTTPGQWPPVQAMRHEPEAA